MKRFINHRDFLCAVAAGLLVSCSVESPWSADDNEGGFISLNLATDCSVKALTRASDGISPVKPDGDNFRIKLESHDGSYSKEWETLGKFNDEEKFPKGTYHVTASYGNENEQGFAHPYYVGTETVTVVARETTEHSVTASLANSMVSVRYTENFTNYFSQYSAYLESAGIKAPVVFARGEDRPAYVKPGNITVNFNITSDEGQEVTVSPASFTALPRRHYILTADVKETTENGIFALNVEFEETVEFVDREIILSDELFHAPAPKVLSQGFAFGDKIETFESAKLESDPKIQIIAEAGISEAKFSVETGISSTIPAFGKEVDLISADAVTQQLINQSKLNCYGFFRKPSGTNAANIDMGVIELKDFIENLQPDTYTFSITVKDKLGRVFESDSPLSLSADIKPIIFKVEEDAAPKFMSEELTVLVSTNCPSAKEVFSFNSEGPDGKIKPASVVKVEDVETSDAVYLAKYRYTLNVGEIDDTQWHVEVVYPNKEKQQLDVTVSIPGYKVEVDAFAKKALLKIVPDDSSDLALLVNKAKFYWGNGQDVVNASQISRDASTGFVTISGLMPGKENILNISYGTKIDLHKTSVPFTTEENADVPNGNFSSSSSRLQISGIQVGGQYKVSPTSYTIKASIDRDLPDGWATVNQLTCYEGSSNKNTWFMVPSTYVDGGKCVLRNVGYNHNGTTPPTSGGAFNTKYYCENAPEESGLNKRSGELFLGHYSFNGTEDRTDGIAFASRPSSLKFKYKYSPVNDDRGEMLFKIFDETGVAIAEGYMDLTDTSETERVVEHRIGSYPFGKKASVIQLRFRSSKSDNPPVLIPKGSELNEGLGLGNKTINDPNKYHALATGSELIIDDVELVYE